VLKLTQLFSALQTKHMRPESNTNIFQRPEYIQTTRIATHLCHFREIEILPQELSFRDIETGITADSNVNVNEATYANFYIILFIYNVSFIFPVIYSK